MKIKICSNEHFKRLLKSFSKKFLQYIENNTHFNCYKQSFKIFYYGYSDDINGEFFRVLSDLENSFKLNPYKTKSCFIVKDRFYKNYNLMEEGKDVKVKISYTIEDENFKRVLNNDFINKFIVFRVNFKVNNHKEKRIFRWRVKMDWIK